MLIEGKVYDVTNFKHPGGQQLLISNAGQDATTQFEDVNHPADAIAMLDDYYVGRYTGYVVDDHKNSVQSDSTDGVTKFFLVAMFIGVMFYLYTNLTQDPVAKGEM